MTKLLIHLGIISACFAQPNPTIATYLSNTTSQFLAVRQNLTGRIVPALPLRCANHYLMAYNGEAQLFSIASGSRVAAINNYTDSLIASGINCFMLNEDMALAFTDPNNFKANYDAGLQHMLGLSTPPTLIFRATLSASFQAIACAFNGSAWCSSGSSFTGGTPTGYTGLGLAWNQALNTFLSRSTGTTPSTWGAAMSGGINVAHEPGILIPANTGITGATSAQNQSFIDAAIVATVALSCCTTQHFFATVVSSGGEEAALGILLAQDSNITAVGVDLYYPGNCTYPCSGGSGGADTSKILQWLQGVAGASGPVGGSNFYGKPWYPDEVGPINLEYTGIGSTPPPGESTALWGYGSPYSAIYNLDYEWFRTVFMWAAAQGCCQTYGGPEIYASAKFFGYSTAPGCQYITPNPTCSSAATCQCLNDNLSLPSAGTTVWGGIVTNRVVNSIGTYNATSSLTNLFQRLSNIGWGGAN